MKKNLILFSALASFILLASASGCNEKNAEKVALEQKTEVAKKEVEVKTPSQDNKLTVVTDGEPENLKKCPKILVSTEFGDMKIALYNSTPKHRDNILKLVKEGYYDDLLFHRVIEGFMIQGGDPNSKGAAADARLGSGGPGYQIDAEFNTMNIHKKGALSAARTGAGNPMKKSSGSQYYIVQGKVATDASLDGFEKKIQSMYPETKDFKYTEAQREAYKTIGGTPFLDMDYTVYGEVIEGLDVIDKIAAVQKNRSDRPIENVKMTIEVVKK